MNNRSNLLSYFSEPRKYHDPELFVGPKETTKTTIPNDIGLQLDFPESVQSPEEKVLYALWREGDQSLSSTFLLTGLPTNELKAAVEKLSSENRIILKRVSTSSGEGLSFWSYLSLR
ncbi:MAG: hypothetical protein P8103_15605 [Candidatus Thiodiazotropha sp.]|jgi:hypothetical protein